MYSQIYEATLAIIIHQGNTFTPQSPISKVDRRKFLCTNSVTQYFCTCCEIPVFTRVKPCLVTNKRRVRPDFFKLRIHYRYIGYNCQNPFWLSQEQRGGWVGG